MVAPVARLSTGPAPASSGGPITVIVPSRDRFRDLRRCLHALAECDTRLLHEVVIVDDGSRPRISDAAAVPGLRTRLIRNPRPIGATRSRCRAAELAVSPVLAFLDDDALPRADWLTRISEELTPDRGGITGRVLPFDSGLVSQARQARYQQRYRGLGAGQRVAFFAGGNGAVWRDAFLAAGGMSVTGPGGDNRLVDDLAKLGLDVHFVPSLVIVHRNSKGFGRAVTDAFGAGRHRGESPSVSEIVREVTRPAPGVRPIIRLTNRVLNVVHLTGRCLPAKAR
ncbi:glycosyltransferase family 2 protein [Spongiactinospora sp. TRM90649]|uniref:glycosyltransferase family 2 protein n=1 Tax=Spongiactinospora sp. TRM90649 TaxID=3031114 RepID=UPI0023F734BE|nr:glycosyltransferase family 2 protein [Spongiactinospora sp. TRM90649]MDF5757683.1 glycosyltransferase family 2 protein [Spongiactinospora sp. TRM90649]